MFDGILDFSLTGDVLVTLLMTHITMAAVTIFLHRHQAHRALELHPLVAHFFRFWLWLTTGMVTREWVAIHRKHHAKCETADDPHSPQVLGLRTVLWQGAELYRHEAAKRDTLEQYGQGTPGDWVEKHVYTPHNYHGVALLLVLDVWLFGLPGISMWAIQMLWVPFWAAGVINGVGHFWGYRNYECSDASRNIVPWGILIAGEELHNNHHTYANSARLSSKPWEFDIGWFYIRALSIFRLAKVNRVAPEPVLDRSKQEIDSDTIKAIVVNRFQIMARYSKEVIGRVKEDELRRARGAERNLLKRAKLLLTREDKVMTDSHRLCRTQLLAQNKAMSTVYLYKQRLQALWQRSDNTKPDKLFVQLQDWCRQAEATGIEALRDFSRNLKIYVSPSLR